jgi:hypothetical protein
MSNEWEGLSDFGRFDGSGLGLLAGSWWLVAGSEDSMCML